MRGRTKRCTKGAGISSFRLQLTGRTKWKIWEWGRQNHEISIPLPDLSMNVLGGRQRKPVASLYGADNFESRPFVLAPVKNSAHRHAESLFENNWKPSDPYV
jgi:hypothetical protein